MATFQRPCLYLQQIVEGRLVVGCRCTLPHCRDLALLLSDTGVADPNRWVGCHHFHLGVGT